MTISKPGIYLGGRRQKLPMTVTTAKGYKRKANEPGGPQQTTLGRLPPASPTSPGVTPAAPAPAPVPAPAVIGQPTPAQNQARHQAAVTPNLPRNNAGVLDETATPQPGAGVHLTRSAPPPTTEAPQKPALGQPSPAAGQPGTPRVPETPPTPNFIETPDAKHRIGGETPSILQGIAATRSAAAQAAPKPAMTAEQTARAKAQAEDTAMRVGQQDEANREYYTQAGMIGTRVRSRLTDIPKQTTRMEQSPGLGQGSSVRRKQILGAVGQEAAEQTSQNWMEQQRQRMREADAAAAAQQQADREQELKVVDAKVQGDVTTKLVEGENAAIVADIKAAADKEGRQVTSEATVRAAQIQADALREGKTIDANAALDKAEMELQAKDAERSGAGTEAARTARLERMKGLQTERATLAVDTSEAAVARKLDIDREINRLRRMIEQDASPQASQGPAAAIRRRTQPASANVPGSGTGEDPYRPATPEQAAALPKGSIIVLPTGERRRI